MKCILSFFFACVLCACNNSSELKNFQGWIYYFDNSDTLKAISITDKKTFSLNYIPSTYGQHNISNDGKKIIYGVKHKINDTIDDYNIHISDIVKGSNQLVRKGYGGAWSNDDKHFIVFMEDSIWLYDYPSIKLKKVFTYKKEWRLCSIDWTPSNKFLVVFTYDRNNRDNTKLLLLGSDSMNVIKEQEMDGMFTKQFVAVNDDVFLCCAECSKCVDPTNSTGSHVLKIELTKLKIFTHFPVNAFGSETIALSENTKYVFYPNITKKSVVMSPIENMDSSTILIPAYVTILGFSQQGPAGLFPQ